MAKLGSKAKTNGASSNHESITKDPPRFVSLRTEKIASSGEEMISDNIMFFHIHLAP